MCVCDKAAANRSGTQIVKIWLCLVTSLVMYEMAVMQGPLELNRCLEYVVYKGEREMQLIGSSYLVTGEYLINFLARYGGNLELTSVQLAQHVPKCMWISHACV